MWLFIVDVLDRAAGGQLLAVPGFRDDLQALVAAWRRAQASAFPLDRRQQAATLDALYAEADALNDLLHAKLHAVCVAHGGTFHRADVKDEARALQKVFRSYGGDWRRLTDLCRASLVFETVPQAAACLDAIGKDSELLLVPTGDIVDMRAF